MKLWLFDHERIMLERREIVRMEMDRNGAEKERNVH